ncbi:MAG: acyl-CoA synthetase (AMP-forming)/AMP-acid ligase II [Lentimonas sp.]|jgi:acyl-CoA synthetase (AMP-forming)/AMP-acid ligase II
MSNWLIERFSEYGHRPVLAHGNAVHTYAELANRIETLTDTFKSQGVCAGDVITLETDYSLSAIAALFALFQLNTIVVPLSTTTDAEIQIRRTEARAHWAIQLENDRVTLTSINRELHPHELVLAIAKKEHPGLVLFSSGSTGRPKAMIHDADRLLSQFAKKRARRLSILIFLMFDHIGGLNTLFNGLASGALMVVPASRDPHCVGAAIASHGVTLLPASPTFLNLLLMSGAHKNYNLSSLRFVTYGTEPMPDSLLIRLKTALPNISFIQTFGTSETGISQTVSRSSVSTQIKIEDPNTEFKIVAGELWLRSNSQILGYLNHEMSRFTADGWFKTGDIVEESSDGFLTITGRREDIINVGGEKVTPSEVESVLLEIPEVADCLVYGEKNAITGQNVAAEIVPQTECDLKMLKRIIKKHCRAVLSAYKVPARIVFTEKTSFSDRFKKSRISQKELAAGDDN